MRPPRVCFVCPQAYPLFNPEVHAPFGGAEVQIYYLSRGMAQQGVHVSVIVDDHGQPAREVREGVHLLATRFGVRLRDRLALQRLLRQSRADAVVQHGYGSVTKEVAWFRLWHRKTRYIYMIAHDMDVDAKAQEAWGRPLPRFFHWGMLRADAIVAQNPAQVAQLERRFGRSSVLIYYAQPPMQAVPQRDVDVLWMGKFAPVKRPLPALDIAARTPNLRHVFICAPDDEAMARQAEERLKDLPNVTYIPGLPFHEAAQWYPRARVFLSTSAAEGMPNVFLQAAAAGTPIVSLAIDANEMISRHGCGLLTGDDVAAAALAVESLLEDEAAWQACGNAGRTYIERFHQLNVAVKTLLRVCEGEHDLGNTD